MHSVESDHATAFNISNVKALNVDAFCTQLGRRSDQEVSQKRHFPNISKEGIMLQIVDLNRQLQAMAPESEGLKLFCSEWLQCRPTCRRHTAAVFTCIQATHLGSTCVRVGHRVLCHFGAVGAMDV
jgi:hypothetical protein